MIFKLECASLKFCVITCLLGLCDCQIQNGTRRRLKSIVQQCGRRIRFSLEEVDVSSEA